MSMPSLDVSILLGFLQPSKDQILCASAESVQLSSLETLSAMCSNSNSGIINCLRDLGGINLIWNLCCNSNSLQVTNSCIFALSSIVQNDVYAQQELCLNHVFSSLTALIISAEVAVKTKTLSTYLLLSIVSKNKQGQTMMCSSGCLKALISIFIDNSKTIGKLKKISSDQLEFFKVTAKTLSYAASVPQNVENQNHISAVLPWLINVIHTARDRIEIISSLCELLTVVVEDNDKNQRLALKYRAVEVLILLVNNLLNYADDDCLGNTVAALNQVLGFAEKEHWKKFVSFGGLLLLVKLIQKSPDEKWIVYHINQTLTLLSNCFEKCTELVEEKYFQLISHNVVKLMKVISDDEYFHKMAVHVLDIAIGSNPVQPPPKNCNTGNKSSYKLNNPSIASFSSIFDSQTSQIWENDKYMTEDESNRILGEEKSFSTVKNHQRFTTILVNTSGSGHKEMVLDISKSSKQALKLFSGINMSPTEDIFTRPPKFGAFRCRKNNHKPCEQFFKKPCLLSLKSKSREPSFSKVFGDRKPFVDLCKKATVKYSTPKSSVYSDCRFLLGKGSANKKAPSSVIASDVVSLCGDLIDREALMSVKKQFSLQRHGSSGLLVRNTKQI